MSFTMNPLLPGTPILCCDEACVNCGDMQVSYHHVKDNLYCDVCYRVCCLRGGTIVQSTLCPFTCGNCGKPYVGDHDEHLNNTCEFQLVRGVSIEGLTHAMPFDVIVAKTETIGQLCVAFTRDGFTVRMVPGIMKQLKVGVNKEKHTLRTDQTVSGTATSVHLTLYAVGPLTSPPTTRTFECGTHATVVVNRHQTCPLSLYTGRGIFIRNVPPNRHVFVDPAYGDLTGVVPRCKSHIYTKDGVVHQFDTIQCPTFSTLVRYYEKFSKWVSAPWTVLVANKTILLALPHGTIVAYSLYNTNVKLEFGKDDCEIHRVFKHSTMLTRRKALSASEWWPDNGPSKDSVCLRRRKLKAEAQYDFIDIAWRFLTPFSATLPMYIVEIEDGKVVDGYNISFSNQRMFFRPTCCLEERTSLQGLAKCLGDKAYQTDKYILYNDRTKTASEYFSTRIKPPRLELEYTIYDVLMGVDITAGNISVLVKALISANWMPLCGYPVRRAGISEPGLAEPDFDDYENLPRDKWVFRIIADKTARKRFINKTYGKITNAGICDVFTKNLVMRLCERRMHTQMQAAPRYPHKMLTYVNTNAIVNSSDIPQRLHGGMPAL